jgi:hypothetical protein
MKNQTNLKNPLKTKNVQFPITSAYGENEGCVRAEENKVVFYIVEERGGQSVWGEWYSGDESNLTFEDREIPLEELANVKIVRIEETEEGKLIFYGEVEEYTVDSNTLPLQFREVK